MSEEKEKERASEREKPFLSHFRHLTCDKNQKRKTLPHREKRERKESVCLKEGEERERERGEGGREEVEQSSSEGGDVSNSLCHLPISFV